MALQQIKEMNKHIYAENTSNEERRSKMECKVLNNKNLSSYSNCGTKYMVTYEELDIQVSIISSGMQTKAYERFIRIA